MARRKSGLGTGIGALVAGMATVAVVTAAGVWIRPSPALAAASYGENVTVPAGQRVNNLVVFGGSAEVAGEVREEVIVVLGDLSLKSTARVGEGVTVLGGRIVQEPGAVVGKDIYHLDLGTATLNGLLLGALAWVGLEGARAAVFATLIAAVVAFNLLFERAMERAATRAAVDFRRSVLLGIAGTGAGLTGAGLLALTFVGLPVALLVLLAIPVLGVLGVSAIGRSLGSAVLARAGGTPPSPLAVAGVGGLFLALAGAAPVVGLLFQFGLLVAGVGVWIAYLLDGRRQMAG